MAVLKEPPASAVPTGIVLLRLMPSSMDRTSEILVLRNSAAAKPTVELGSLLFAAVRSAR